MKFKNNVGYTPLHLAAKLGYVRVVEELLAVGANAALKDKVGLAHSWRTSSKPLPVPDRRRQAQCGQKQR